jgi:DNA polymerase I
MPATLQDAYQLFHKGSFALSRMERNGIRIDTEKLDRSIADLSKRIEKINRELAAHPTYDLWKKEYGEKANLSSREQLGYILFDHLGYEYKGEKTKSGRYKADDEYIHGTGDEFAKRILQLEHLKKAKATYLEGIRSEVVDGLMHPFFNLNTVITYRSSSSNPNLQNFPIRDPEMGRIIRSCFIPRDGHVLIEIDFSALEFRIAACVWDDPNMIAYAADPTKDIHRDVAAKCYLLKKEHVSKDSRYCGKNGFVFPRLYGSYHKQIARNMWEMIREKKLRAGKDDALPMKKHLEKRGIKTLGDCDPKTEARSGTFEYNIKAVEEWFDSEFHVFRDKKEQWIRDYRQRGWFQMVTGFVISGLHNNNFLLNAPIQGPGFHCLLWCAIQMQKWLDKWNMKTLAVGEIHDCLLFDAPVDEVQDVLNAAKDIMTNRIRKAWPWIVVPMGVEVDVVDEGKSWADKAPWEEVNGTWQPKK